MRRESLPRRSSLWSHAHWGFFAMQEQHAAVANQTVRRCYREVLQ